MVRHTHRRRQSRGRRRNTRRSRRTQRGGFSFSSFFGIGSKDLAELQQELAAEQDPIKKAEIQEKLDLEMLEQNYEKDKKKIKDRVANGANGAAISSTSVNNMTRSSDGRFQSPAATANGNGLGVSNMFSGGRRKSRRYRRR